MKKTQQTATAPTPATRRPATGPAAAATSQPPTSRPKKPSEYALLARVMYRASNEDRLLLREILTDCADGLLPVAEAALRASSHALGLGLSVEDITDYADDFRGLTQVTIHGGWLYRFLNLLFCLVNRGEEVTPETLFHMAETHLLNLEDNVDTAREIIRERPEAVAKEIRQAVAARPGLLAPVN